MATKKCMQLAAIAALAASVLTMGGTAFAAPASGAARGDGYTTGLIPGPVGDASEFARDNAADVRNQIHRHQW